MSVIDLSYGLHSEVKLFNIAKNDGFYNYTPKSSTFIRDTINTFHVRFKNRNFLESLTSKLDKILEENIYKNVSLEEKAMLGVIILYVNKEGGNHLLKSPEGSYALRYAFGQSFQASPVAETGNESR